MISLQGSSSLTSNRLRLKQKNPFFANRFYLPEKRLELAYNRKSVKKQAVRVVLGLSDNSARSAIHCATSSSLTANRLHLKQKSLLFTNRLYLPEKRLELAYNRKSVKKQAVRVVLGLSDNSARSQIYLATSSSRTANELWLKEKTRSLRTGFIYRRRDLNSYAIADKRF